MYHVNLAGGLDQSDEQLATTKSSNLYAELKLYINGSDWGSATWEERKKFQQLITIKGFLCCFYVVLWYLHKNGGRMVKVKDRMA